MSANSLATDLIRAAGTFGSHETREARERHLARFAAWSWQTGFQIHKAVQLRDKHIHGFVQSRLKEGVKLRTIQNELASIRKSLSGAGRTRYANGPTISNKALGLSGASRKGSKVAMTNDLFTQFIAQASARDSGVTAGLRLQRWLGLREKEAVMSMASLADWRRTLAVSGEVYILHGTKGGRARTSRPADIVEALHAIDLAIAIAKDNGGHLINKPTLKQALDRYSYVCRSIGMVGEQANHSLRYAYACDHLCQLREIGFSLREARAAVAMMLGHGDGRGRWVAMIYSRQTIG